MGGASRFAAEVLIWTEPFENGWTSPARSVRYVFPGAGAGSVRFDGMKRSSICGIVSFVTCLRKKLSKGEDEFSVEANANLPRASTSGGDMKAETGIMPK